MKTQSKPLYTFLSPRYWPIWLGFGILWLITKFPIKWQLNIGRLLGSIGKHIKPNLKHVTAINLKLCFPELSDSEREQLLERSFESVGMGLIEIALAWWGSNQKIKSLFQVEGLQYVDQVLAQGKGSIVLGAHFTTLDLCGRILAERYPCSMIYSPAKNRLADAVMLKSRTRIFTQVLHKRNVRSFVNALKNNQLLWYAPDQDYRSKHNVFVPFFGIQTSTITGISRLAKMSSAPVLPIFGYRLPNYQGYQIVISPPLQDFPSDNIHTDTARVNDVIEAAIRRHPEQYLWQHRRFRTRPLGEKSVYLRDK